MRRLSLLFTFLSVVLSLCVVTNLYAYDKKRPDKGIELNYESMFTYVRVRTIGTALGLFAKLGRYQLRKTFFEQEASGFVVRPGFILTCAHVVYPDIVNTPEDRYRSHVTEPLKVLDRTILIYDYKETPTIADLYYIDREIDIAILRYHPYGILKSMDYSVEYNPFLLQRDDILCTVVHGRDENGEITYDLQLKWGITLAVEPTTPMADNREIAYFSPYDITVDLPVFEGDSGSPLFAFKNGKPVLIGIIRAGYYDGIVLLGYAVTLPGIMRYIEAWNGPNELPSR